MVDVAFEGPEPVFRCLHKGADYLFERGGPPVSCPEDLAESLLTMNPRGLPLYREEGYDGPLAEDYGQKAFRVVAPGETYVPLPQDRFAIQLDRPALERSPEEQLTRAELSKRALKGGDR